MIQEGLLWYDNDPQRKVVDKIQRAAERYRARLHRKPTVCYLNAKDLDGELEEIDGLHIKAVTNILPHHFLVGVEQTSVSKVA
jgi:hypothetical protein